MALAMVANLMRADAATRATRFVRCTRGKAGVLGTPEALTKCVHFYDLVSPFLRLHSAGLRLRVFLLWGWLVGWFSASRNTGPTISRSKCPKIAMLPVSCG